MEWLIRYAPAILAILGILGFLGGFGAFIYRVGKWKGSVDDNFNKFNAFMNEVRSDIKTILRLLSPAPPIIETKSPLQLTDFGREIAQDIHADEIIAHYAQALQEKVRGMQE